MHSHTPHLLHVSAIQIYAISVGAFVAPAFYFVFSYLHYAYIMFYITIATTTSQTRFDNESNREIVFKANYFISVGSFERSGSA